MQEYVETAKKLFTSASRKVLKKSSEVYETTKVSLKISSLKSEIDEQYKKIGNIIYDNYKGADASTDEVESVFAEIDKLKAQIGEYEDQLALLKNMETCPHCGAGLTKESTFCAKCGEKI